jgi:nonribosomal peptide synthetase DhbF
MTADGIRASADSAARPGTDRTSDSSVGQAAGASPYRPPQNVRQKVLCDILADVLRLPRVGIDDDFFALGGRSIDGVFITARASAELSCQLSLIDLFDAPTVAELDRHLDGRAGDDSQGERTDLR